MDLNNCELVKVITKVELEKMIRLHGIEETGEMIERRSAMPYFKFYLLREYNNILKTRLNKE